MKRKNILYIISTLDKTGPVNVLYGIVKHLDREQFNPIIVTLSKETKNSAIDDFKKLGIRIHSLNLNRLQGYLFGGFALKKIIQKIDPDIIHSQCFRSNLFSAFFLNSFNRCSTVHSNFPEDFIMAYGFLLGKLMEIINLISLKKIKNNICVSEKLSDVLNGKFTKLDFLFVNNGIDTEKFFPIKDKIELRRKLKLPLDKKLFIWAGVFIDIKDPVTFAKAIKKANISNASYVFSGEGLLKKNCEKYLANFDNVLFTGNIDNIDEYYRASDYFVATSLSEGLPMAAIEAMASGLPILTSDINAYSIFFEKSNNIGFKFSPQNSEDLKEKLKQIFQFDYDKMSQEARKIVLYNFSSSSMSENYQKIYIENIENKGII